MATNNETEKLLSPKRRSKGAERQKEEGGISDKDVAMFAAEMIPGVGEAMAVKRTSDALDEKDYLGAGIEATAGLLGIIPGVGDAAGKTLRATTKGLRKEKTETIPVFPKPERMFPEGERPKGGKYLNPITGDDLTGMNVPNANLKINPDGKPSFNVTNKNVDSVGTTGKGNTQIKTNLFKSKAGWKWKDSTVDTDNINTLISVTHKGKHYYTLETDFSKGVTLKNYPESKTEPKLRPTVQGQLEMGTPIGTISVRGVEHPVYDKVITFAEGGVVPMDRQMSMFDDGGLMDEGGTVDPVSGNDVPPGSTQEEVRDDIPAQLSEGEFVFPADVVRYIGLGNLMRMRQEAKMGLKLMDQMGQMGNSEEATMPDDLPFDINDLDMEDEIDDNNELEMQVGGFVQPTQQQQQMGISGYQQAAAPTTGVAAVPQAASSAYEPQRPVQAVVPTVQTGTQPQLSFKQLVQEDLQTEVVEYRNEAGQVEFRTINKATGQFIPGQPDLPDGFTKYDPTATATEEVTTTPTTPQTTQVSGEGGDDEARQRREEEMYGPGGGRLGVKGKTYGISFDGVGLLEGRGMLTGLALSGEIPDKYATSVSVNIKRGDDEFAVRGDAYNELKEVIEDSGANSPAAENKLAELRRRSNAIKEAKRKAQEEFDRLAKLKENEEERKRTKVQPSSDDPGGKGPFGTGYTYDPKSVKETTDYVESGYQEASGGGGGGFGSGSPSSSSGSSSSSSSGSSKSSSSGSSSSGSSKSSGGSYGAKDSTGGSRRFDEGGLASKPKPKTKKMKRGGLASKK